MATAAPRRVNIDRKPVALRRLTGNGAKRKPALGSEPGDGLAKEAIRGVDYGMGGVWARIFRAGADKLDL
jgi:hypothetical protein